MPSVHAVLDSAPNIHVNSYVAAFNTPPMRGFQELVSLLLSYLQLARGGGSGLAPEEQAHAIKTLPAMLASPSARAAIRRQLEQLSAEQPEGQLPFT